MGDVGGKLPAQALALFPLGHVHHEDDGPGDLAVGNDGVGENLNDLLPQVHEGLGVVPGQGAAGGHANFPAAVLLQVLRLLLLPQQGHGPLVAGEDVVLPVEQQHALVHVLGQGGKLPLAALQGLHLLVDGAVLLPQAADQGEEFLIGLVSPRVFQVDAVDGLCDLPRQAGGQQRRDEDGQHQDQQHRLQHAQQNDPHRRLHAGQTQDGPVVQADGVVERLLQQRVGQVLALAAALLFRLLDLAAVGVVLHGGGVSHAVVEDGAVLGHPGQALLRAV